MPGETLYEVALYSLLHDIGKPIIRLSLRYSRNIEHNDNAKKILEDIIGLLGFKDKTPENLYQVGHDAVFVRILHHILDRAPNENYIKRVKYIVSAADRLSAAERGYGKEYAQLVRGVEEKLGDILPSYTHYTAPLLSPTWLLYMADYLKGSGYYKVIGERWDHGIGLANIRDKLRKLTQSIQGKMVNETAENIAKLLRYLMDKPIWLPVEPLTPEIIVNLRANKYSDVDISYLNVVSTLIDLLANYKKFISEAYGSGIVNRGIIDTVLHILESTLFLVPSAAYGTLVPDISLYSHSKLVAAYASSLYYSGRMRLLTIDANGIQGFISAPKTFAAASRILRGRSLLVELMLDSLTKYALELFGRLPETNIIVSEGGTIDLIIPSIEGLNDKIGLIVNVANNMHSEFKHGINFTIAYSKEFTLDEAFFLPVLKGEKRGFIDVIESLTKNLSIAKALRPAGSMGRIGKPIGYDELTKEPIVEGEEYLEITPENKAYFDLTAGPENLDIGDMISYSTHLSLVAGSTLRNLFSIIAIYAYRRDDEYLPDTEYIRALKEKLCKYIARYLGGEYHGYELVFSYTGAEEIKATRRSRIRIGVIPLSSSGSLYIMISLDVEETPKLMDREYWGKVWFELVNILREIIKRSINELENEEYIQQYKDKRDVMIRVNIVNMPSAFIPISEEGGGFIPSVQYKDLVRTIRDLAKKADVGLGFNLLNTYHPIEVESRGDGSNKIIRLISLDRYHLIGMSKIDIDSFGEVRALISFSPSRLVTLSDLVNMVLKGKLYLLIIDYASTLSRRFERNVNFDAIALYAGGDDLVFYGNWIYIAYLTARIFEELENTLKPLTASAGMVFADPHYPILELYNRVIDELEDAKRVKASIKMPYETLHLFIHNNDEYSINVTPALRSAWENAPVLANWSYHVISRLFDPLRVKDIINRLSDYKRDLYILSNLAYLYQEYYKSPRKSLADRVKLEVSYAYVWSRRRERLDKVNTILSNVDSKLKIPIYPDDIVGNISIDEALRILSNSKAIIDLIILAIRRKEDMEPTEVYNG